MYVVRNADRHTGADIESREVFIVNLYPASVQVPAFIYLPEKRPLIFHGKPAVCGYFSQPSPQFHAVCLFRLALPGSGSGKHIPADSPKRVPVVQVVLKTRRPGILVAQADKLLQPFGIFRGGQLLSDAPEFLFLCFDAKGQLQIACIFQFVPVSSGAVPGGSMAGIFYRLSCRKIYFLLFAAE